MRSEIPDNDMPSCLVTALLCVCDICQFTTMSQGIQQELNLNVTNYLQRLQNSSVLNLVGSGAQLNQQPWPQVLCHKKMSKMTLKSLKKEVESEQRELVR